MVYMELLYTAGHRRKGNSNQINSGAYTGALGGGGVAGASPGFKVGKATRK